MTEPVATVTAARRPRPWTLFVLVPVFAYAPMVAIHASCITGLGGWSIAGVELFVLLWLAALVALPITAVCAWFGPAGRCVLAAGAGLAIAFVPALYLGSAARTWGFHLAAERAKPLVAAVEAYVRDHGAPPDDLPSLSPRYLARMPSGLPPLELQSGRDVLQPPSGDRWVLRASVPTAILGFETFCYASDGDFRGLGGHVERIGDWAIVSD